MLPTEKTDETSAVPETRNILLSVGLDEQRIHSGIRKYSRGKHWTLHFDPHSTAIQTLTNISADGAIVSCRDEACLEWVKSLSCPCVLMFDDRFELGMPNVAMDNVAIGAMAADYLVGRGFRNFACLYPHRIPPTSALEDRIQGFEKGVRDVGGSLHLALRSGAKRSMSNVSWYQEQLKTLKRPLGVFVLQDSDAGFLQTACLGMDLLIPDDIAMVAVNNDPMVCPYTPIPLSSVDPGWFNLGYRAARVLEGLTCGEPPVSPQVLQPRRIVERQSSSIIAVEDRRVARALSYIENNLHSPLTVADVCTVVGVPTRALAGAFRKHLDRGIKAEIQAARIREVKRLLVESDLTSTAIARQLNFTSEYWMFKLFKKHTGLTTREFRLAMRPDDNEADI